MAQDLLVKVQEQVEEWDVVWVKGWAGWEEIVPVQVPAEIAFAPVAEQRFRIR